MACVKIEARWEMCSRASPVDLAGALVERLNLTVAVETGTYQGASTRQLAGLVSRVHTVELSEVLAARAAAALADLPNVVCHKGPSVAVLEELSNSIDGPILAWLDAHWSGGETAGVNDECPVLAEIAALDALPEAKRSCILVDDARVFLASPPPPHNPEDWPTLQELIKSMTMIHKRYVSIVDDVVVAGPVAVKDTIDCYAKSMAPHLQQARWSIALRQAPAHVLFLEMISRSRTSRAAMRLRDRMRSSQGFPRR